MKEWEYKDKYKLISCFAKLVNHDLLNIINYLNLASITVLGKTTEPEILEILNEFPLRFKTMERIIRNFETVLKEEKLEYKKTAEIFKKAVSLFPELKDIQIKYDCPGLLLLADSRLMSVFLNLLDNSLKYGGKNLTKIRLYCKQEENGLKLIFEDNGKGVAKKEKEKIFEQGYGRGTGRGLYLVRKIIQSYGWQIKETGQELKGAQFTIFIPNPRKRR